MIFYDKIPDMECLSGDTLPDFIVSVESEDSLTGCSMQLILANAHTPDKCVVCKECTLTDDGFTVQLDSSDTSKLAEGTYNIHFRLITPDERSYRKLFGSLYIHTAAQGVDQ